MEIKERVYTLKKYTPDNNSDALYLYRNDEKLYCPRQSSGGSGIQCGEDCPAFEIKSGYAILNCFPQPTAHKIEEV